MFEDEPDIYAAFDSAGRNFECAKRPMIMGLWAVWAFYGRKFFAAKMEYLCDLADQAFLLLVG